MALLLRKFAIWAALVLVASQAHGEQLRLSIDWARVGAVVEITAAATNDGGDDVELCGRWRSHTVYRAGATAEARAESLSAASYTRCGGGLRLPLWIDGRLPDLDPAPYMRNLGPGQSMCDTLRILLPVASAKRDLSAVEVWYYLDLCDVGVDPERVVPWNAAGGAVVAVIPVP